MRLTTRQVMERQGWVVASEDEPGIYVRQQEARERDPMDLNVESSEIRQDYERFMQEAHAKENAKGRELSSA